MNVVAKQRKPADEGAVAFDRELDDLPQELRWREWIGRIEAVLCAIAYRQRAEVAEAGGTSHLYHDRDVSDDVSFAVFAGLA